MIKKLFSLLLGMVQAMALGLLMSALVSKDKPAEAATYKVNPFTSKFDLFSDTVTVSSSGSSDIIQAADYGVEADGVTDDKTALNNAWNAVIALPRGGILQLPAGTIYLSTKWAPTQPGTGKSVWLRGAGRDSTIFKFDTTDGNNSYILKFAGTSASNRYLGSVKLSDFSFDNSAWGLDGVARLNSGTVVAVSSFSVTLSSNSSATSSFYDGSTFVVVQDTGNPVAVGQNFSITSGKYNGTTKVLNIGSWGAGRTPTTAARYGILLNSSDSDDQPTRGCGRILFQYTDNQTIENLGTYGGHGWIDLRGANNGLAQMLYANTVAENAFNFLGGTDSVTDPNPRNWVVQSCIFKSGEGIDSAVDYAIFSNIYCELLGDDDECLDLNSSHYVTVSDLVSYGGHHPITLHGSAYSTNPYESSYDIRLDNIVGREFYSAGLSVLYGVTGSRWRVELGTPTAGTFTLTYGGATTSGIAYNASSTTVQTALEALSTIDPGDITVTAPRNGGPYLITFTDETGGTVTGSGASLTSGTFTLYNMEQQDAADQVKNIFVSNSSFISSVAGARGIEASWTSTSYPLRIGDMTISNVYVDVSSEALVAPYSKNLTVRDSTFKSTYAEAALVSHATYKSEDVHLEHCRFSGKGTSTTTGAIYFSNAIRPIIRDSILDIGSNWQGYGINIKNSKNPRILDNSVRGAGSHGIVMEWTSTANIDPDLDLKAQINGNRVMQFGNAQSGRFGISVTNNQAGTYSGLQVKDNYVNATTSYDVSTGGASGGTFTLTFNSSTTYSIAYNATAAEVQTALEDAGINKGNVSVVGVASGPWYVDFIGTLDNTSNALTGSGAGLTGGSFAVTTHTASKAYNIAFSGSPSTIDATLSNNQATDFFGATSKWTVTNLADSSAIYGNKFGSTYGGGFTVSNDGWFQNDVPAAQAATEASYYELIGSTVAFSTARWIAPKPGSITRVWAKTSTAVTAGTLTATVYKNGSTTAFATSLTSGTTGYAIQPSGQDTFALGDALSIYITTDGSFAPTTLDLRSGFDVEY